MFTLFNTLSVIYFVLKYMNKWKWKKDMGLSESKKSTTIPTEKNHTTECLKAEGGVLYIMKRKPVVDFSLFPSHKQPWLQGMLALNSVRKLVCRLLRKNKAYIFMKKITYWKWLNIFAWRFWMPLGNLTRRRVLFCNVQSPLLVLLYLQMNRSSEMCSSIFPLWSVELRRWVLVGRWRKNGRWRCAFEFLISDYLLQSYILQGFYNFWKSGKIGRHFSSQGKVREFGIFLKNQGKIREFWWHNIFLYFYDTIYFHGCRGRITAGCVGPRYLYS